MHWPFSGGYDEPADPIEDFDADDIVEALQIICPPPLPRPLEF